MRKELIISTIPQETRVAVLEDDELVEFLIERHRSQSIAGNIYKGRVTKVLPGMQSAFVDIGLDRDAFLYVSDFLEDVDEYDRIVSSAEAEAFKEGDSPRRQRPSRSRPDKAPKASEPEIAKEVEVPPVAEPQSSPGPSDKPAPRRRDDRVRNERDRRDDRERRDRKPWVPSFESPQTDAPAPGGLALLPGESLAKYKDRNEGAQRPRSAGEERGASRGDHTDQAPDRDDTPGAQGPPGRATDTPAGASKEPPPAPAHETEAADPIPPGAATESGQADPVGEDSDERQRRARISERPRDGRFSRRSPVRRPRRRPTTKPEAGQSNDVSGPPMISELLKEGQEILVQVSKEPLGKKGARITSHIALPGRYLVYMPTVDHIGVSRKISSEEERARLRRVINENREGLPGGFIVRTAADGRDEAEFVQDLRFLGDLWRETREKSEKSPVPALIHSDLNLVQRVLRDQLSEEFKAIRLDSEVEYAKVLDFVSRFQPSLVNRVKLHLKENLIFEEYGLQQEVEKAMRAKVWLKSGGYIVVNQTEALVAIDVNTGKFVGKSNRLEDTIVRTNVDAVHELVRQIRLRNLGGIIVVDFIDMEERRSRQKVMQALEEELRKDRSPSKILQFNDFGLVAITRKRTQPSLEKILGTACPRCGGSGHVKAVETICYEIQQEVKKMLGQIEADELNLRVSPEVAKALKSGEFVDFAELEEESKKDIRIQSDPTLDSERFDIY